MPNEQRYKEFLQSLPYRKTKFTYFCLECEQSVFNTNRKIHLQSSTHKYNAQIENENKRKKHKKQNFIITF